MKRRICFVCLLLGVVLVGCGSKGAKENNLVSVEQIPLEEEDTVQKEKVMEQEKVLDETLYIGEYLDENKDPNLRIAKGEDGKYKVQIGIFRLASFDDGVGVLTEEGMLFIATDMAGNPIGGIITIEGQTATVTFIDSTWELIENDNTVDTAKTAITHIRIIFTPFVIYLTI